TRTSGPRRPKAPHCPCRPERCLNCRSSGPPCFNCSKMGQRQRATPRIRSCSRWTLALNCFQAIPGNRCDGDRYAAPTGAGLVRIVENELGGQLVDFVVHLGAEQEQNSLRVDQNANPLVLDNFVELVLLSSPAHRVFHARAAAVLHADAQAHNVGAGGHDLAYALGSSVRQSHHLGPGSCSRHSSPSNGSRSWMLLI